MSTGVTSKQETEKKLGDIEPNQLVIDKENTFAIDWFCDALNSYLKGYVI